MSQLAIDSNTKRKKKICLFIKWLKKTQKQRNDALTGCAPKGKMNKNLPGFEVYANRITVV